MLNNILSVENISFILVFFEGLLSFLSPCVIPLIPIYMSYLAGNAKQTDKEGRITYQRSKVFFHTVFFILGISFAFFVLGMSFTLLGSFFKRNQLLFSRIGGILIFALGLYQVGLFDLKFLQRERKLPIHFASVHMNPLIAFLMGFTFSFAWTPCVGPALSSVLILASGAKSNLLGNLLVLVYSIGFVIPFLLLGLFTAQVLNFLKGHQKLLKYTVKIGGALLILIGIMTFTGWMNGITKYLNSFTPPISSLDIKSGSDSGQRENIANDAGNSPASESETMPTDLSPAEGKESSSSSHSESDSSAENAVGSSSSEEETVIPAIDFTLTDQYGNTHTLSDYKGKVVFLNFWATWCPPCREEMPDIEALYEEYGKSEEDIIFLGVANPSTEEYPNNNDVSREEVIAFLEENQYTFPVVFDETGELLLQYFITSFPTTFLIDKEGNIFGYAPGMLTRDQMENVIRDTVESTE